MQHVRFQLGPLLILLGSVFWNGCSPPVSQTASQSQLIVDDLGRTVNLPAAGQIHRIVSLAPANTEILFAIGAGERVVGVTDFDNYPPEVQQIKKIGGFSANTISDEVVLKLKPDIVFAEGDMHRRRIDSLETSGIPVVCFDPQTVDDVLRNIRLAGTILALTENADKVVEQMQTDLQHFQQQVAQIPTADRVSVFYMVWENPLMSAGPRSFIGQIIASSGGKNVLSDMNELFPVVSEEAVLQRNPDVIVIPQTEAAEKLRANLQQRAGWNETPAVKSDRVLFVNEDLMSRPGPRMVQAMRELAQLLYPELSLAPPAEKAN